MNVVLLKPCSIFGPVWKKIYVKYLCILFETSWNTIVTSFCQRFLQKVLVWFFFSEEGFIARIGGDEVHNDGREIRSKAAGIVLKRDHRCEVA